VRKKRLTFIRNVYKKIYTRPNGYTETKLYDLYKCDCGNEKIVCRQSVQSKASKSTWSCGCLRVENMRRLIAKGLNRNPGNLSRAGKTPHNKGKVAIYLDGRKKFVTKQEADRILSDLYYGN